MLKVRATDSSMTGGYFWISWVIVSNVFDTTGLYSSINLSFTMQASVLLEKKKLI